MPPQKQMRPATGAARDADIVACCGQAYAEAVAHLEKALDVTDDRVGVLLLLARARDRAGFVEQAWEACVAAADLARAAGDAEALADAATIVRDVGPSLAGRIHRLCVEALALLADRDPVRTRKLRARMEATRSPWARRVPALADEGVDQEGHFLALHADHAERIHVDHIERRLQIADEAVALGNFCGSEEYTAAGIAWRIEALGQLGRRVELDAEVRALADVVAGVRQPMWASRLALIRASLLMLDGRFADCAGIVSRESGFVALVVASHLAVLTGDGLNNVEREVRAVLDDVPYFAWGWHALLLGALGRLDEARTMWRAIAPHVRDMPRQSPEWLIGTVGHARMSVLLDDLDTAAVVYEQLLPFARLHAVASGDTPNYGPVSLHLGRLALLLGRAEQVRSQLTAALRAAEGIHALPYVAMAHLELARLSGFPSTEAAAHEEAASRMAARLGMAPLAAEVAALTASRSYQEGGPLSRRENRVGPVRQAGGPRRGRQVAPCLGPGTGVARARDPP